MSVLNATVFGAIAAVVVGGADYALTLKKQEGNAYSVLDHIEFRASGAMSAFGMDAPSEAETEPAKPVICVKKGGAKECSATS